MRYEVTRDNVRLYGSCRIVKRDFPVWLGAIRSAFPDSEVWRRSTASLCLEWAAHNAAYALGIRRERTEDCDLDYPQKWYIRTAYAVAGVLVWPFIP